MISRLTHPDTHIASQYNNGVPADSRLAVEKEDQHIKLRQWLSSDEGKARLEKVRQLSELAEKGESLGVSHALTTKPSHNPIDLGCSVSQLALAWLAAKPATSTVILGASKPEQILDNLKAVDVVPRLTPAVLEKIEDFLDNKPVPRVSAI